VSRAADLRIDGFGASEGFAMRKPHETPNGFASVRKRSVAMIIHLSRAAADKTKHLKIRLR
jgi:hypothetical protein